MRANKCILLLLPAVSPVPFTAALQYTSNVVCNITFSDGSQPNFLLPEAGPNSPGDQQLNEDNPLVEKTNDTAVGGCNGEAAAFEVGEGTWNSTFIGNDGEEYDLDVFYATYDDQLWVRTLQPHMDPSLYEALNNTIIRLNVTCNEDVSGCIEFTTSFTDATPYNATAPYVFNDTCYHGFSTGERVPSVKVPAASPEGSTSPSSLGSNYTIILAGKADQGLPWSEGFNTDGEEKDDEFWSEWWEKTHRGYGRRVSSSDDDDVGRRRLELDAESDCTGSTSEVWDATTGEWVSTFYTLDEQTHNLDMFYMEEVDGMNELWVTEIEEWMAPSLYNQLQYNYVKLSLECPSSTVVESCVIFKPRFTNWSPDISGSMAGYRFSDPAVPTFDVPEAAPNSPGEVLLTSDNAIVQKTGEATETNCNGDNAQYYGEDGEWYSKFIGSDGETYALDHVFYPLQANMYAATIQSVWEPNLRALLKNRTLRIRVWCTNDENAEYLFFRISGESATCDDIEGICEESDFSGTATTVPTSGKCFMVLFTAYSWWLFSFAG